MSEENEQTALLREILKWIRFAGMAQVKSVLTVALGSDQERLIYQLSDGNNSSIDIAKVSGISDFTVRSRWKDWARMGIVEPIRVGRGERFRKSFKLEDFGMEAPQPKTTDAAIVRPDKTATEQG